WVTSNVFQECQRRKAELVFLLKKEVKQILQDVVAIRHMKTYFHSSPPLDESISTALNFKRALETARSEMLERLESESVSTKRKSDLSPFIILEEIAKFKEYVRRTIYYRSSMLTFFALLHIHVCV